MGELFNAEREKLEAFIKDETAQTPDPDFQAALTGFTRQNTETLQKGLQEVMRARGYYLKAVQALTGFLTTRRDAYYVDERGIYLRNPEILVVFNKIVKLANMAESIENRLIEKVRDNASDYVQFCFALLEAGLEEPEPQTPPDQGAAEAPAAQ